MNRLTVMILLSISICLFSQTVLSQDAWSLDACIEYALENNLNLKNLEYSKKAAQEIHHQSYRALLPSVEANTGYNVQYGRSIDPNTNDVSTINFFSNNYGINASMDMFQGFQKLNTIASTKFLFLALEQEREQEKYLLAFRVMQAYYDVQYFEELIRMSIIQQDISQKNLNLVKRQIELGLKAGTDQYEAESILISDQLFLTQNRNSLKAAQLKLVQEMNLQGVSEIQTKAKEELEIRKGSDASISQDTVYQQALNANPTIQAQKLRLLSAEKELAISRGARLPRLSMFAGFGTSFFETNKTSEGQIIPFRTQINENAFQYIGLNVSIPISSAGRVHSQIKTRKLALLQAKNDLDIQKQELRNLIQQLVQDLQASLAEYSQTQQQELSRNLSFEMAQKQFEKGLISALDLYTSKNLYAAAQTAHLQVKLRIQVQEKTLAFYRGVAIFE